MPPSMSLSQKWDQYMKRTDPYWENKENYRVQQEYIRMLKEDPIDVSKWASPTIMYDAQVIAADI